MNRPRRFNYFEVGNEKAGTVILKMINAGRTQADTTYRVRFLCCDSVKELTHRRIHLRMTTLKTGNCPTCARKAKVGRLQVARRTFPIRKARTPANRGFGQWVYGDEDYHIIPCPWGAMSWHQKKKGSE